MALTDENGGMNTTMLVTPTNAAPASNNMFGDGNSWWFLLLFILLLGGGMWGNNYGNNGGFGGQPIVITENSGQAGNQVQRGFDQASIMNGIGGIKDGINGLSTQLCGSCGDMQNTVNQGFFGVQNALCNGFAGVNANVSNGFAGVNAGVANGFAQAEIANNARQIAGMNQAFAAQNAVTQGMNQIGMQLSNGTNETRFGIADLKYTVATENCADRTQSMQNTRDIIDSQTRGTQMILDKLCQLELDGIKGQLAQAQRENVGLQNQLNMANLAASQAAQNTLIQQGFSNEVDQLYNRLNSCPIPSTPVYGRTPIFTCNGQAGGCGCGCGM